MAKLIKSYQEPGGDAMSAQSVTAEPLSTEEISVRHSPASPNVGVVVEDIDVAKMTDAQALEVRGLFDRYSALLFRGQTLTDADQVAFSRHFGDLDHAPVMENGRTAVEGRPEIYVISNIAGADGKPIGSLGAGEAVWHTDMSYLPVPPYASSLYSIEIPPSGGSTWLCSMTAAYDALPDALKERVAGLRVKHDGTYNSGGYVRAGAVETDNPMEAAGTLHPAVITHPRTGRRALYLGRRRNAYVEGLSLDGSEALLDEIWSYATLPENCYCHNWAIGDLLMWDNRTTMHRRDPFDPSSRRLMHRTQVKSDAAPELI